MSWPRTRLAAALCAGVLAGALFPGAASAKKPDRAYATPVAKSAVARAEASISGGKLRRGLRRAFRGVGGGAIVLEPASNRVLFARKAGRKRLLASNMKLFTTAAAISRFGPSEQLETTVWARDPIIDGVANNGLFLRGGGDPTLSNRELAALAGRVRAAGVTQASGGLFYDDTLFDQRTGVSQRGISGDFLANLSALTIDAGRPADPARTTAQRFVDELRRAGVSIGGSVSQAVVQPGTDPLSGDQLVAEVSSPTVAALAKLTNVPSDNYLAEMLVKGLGARFGGGGSTDSGIGVIRSFAAANGSAVKGENGSGLSRADKASPRAVARLLDAMIESQDPAVGDAYVDSLAVAGRSGTLRRRMRGTAAKGRCRAKTGTLRGVSALSGYCFRGERPIVFSFLMSGDVGSAHRAQDRMAALVARFGG
jgi:D-alanyl-D-alanine carboxypeptidase/D-alanyl-D-alanine-endopeptidase (penicillin-binding protein 4)